MKSKISKQLILLQTNVVKVARTHFFFVLAYVLSIIAFDSWNLITPEALSQRWTLAAIMLVVSTVVWYAARARVSSGAYYQALVFGLVLLDIAVAAFTVYTERGMASRGVALFAVAITTSATLISRSALYAAAALSTAAYSLAAVRYFTEFPSEGYKIELYGVIGFYSAIFFVLAALLWAIIRPGPTSVKNS
jgi:hypothetical protein